MSTSLALHTTETVIAEVTNTQRLCKQLMQTPHYAKMGDSGLFAIVQKAKSIGMDPLDALNGGMYFVQGKVEMSGQSMLSLIRAKGHSVSMDPKSTDSCVIMYGKRSDNGDTWKVQFSVDDAKRQGIYRNQWEKMPKVMCMWRCVSQLSRFLFSDVIKGCYVQGEIADAVPFDIPVDTKTGEIIEFEEARKEIEKPQTISTEQANELMLIIAETSEESQSNFEKFLSDGGLSSVDELPMALYEKVKLKAIKSKSEYAQKRTMEMLQIQEEGTVNE